MFDMSWGKLMIIGAIALIVIGPRELPGTLRMLGQMVGKLRRMAEEFRGQFDEAMREAEFADLKRDMEKMGQETRAALAVPDPMAKTETELRAALEASPTPTANASTATPATSGGDVVEAPSPVAPSPAQPNPPPAIEDAAPPPRASYGGVKERTA